MATSFSWVGGAHGLWNDPASWKGGVGIPGAGDSVEIIGEITFPFPGGSVVQGTGTANFASINGIVILDGIFVVDDVVLNASLLPPLNSPGHLNIGAGSSLTGQNLRTGFNNTLVVNGGTLSLMGELHLFYGAAVFRNGATVDVGSLTSKSTTIVLDSTSSLTVAAPGQGVVGAVVVGAGGIIDGRSNPNFSMPTVINNGTILLGFASSTNTVITSGVNNGLIRPVAKVPPPSAAQAVSPRTSRPIFYSGQNPASMLTSPATIEVFA